MIATSRLGGAWTSDGSRRLADRSGRSAWSTTVFATRKALSS
jgi:hypothetical protein